MLYFTMQVLLQVSNFSSYISLNKPACSYSSHLSKNVDMKSILIKVVAYDIQVFTLLVSTNVSHAVY